jgi:acyl-CoA synthetase (AMP-forming)/AMP-acid ligase II
VTGGTPAGTGSTGSVANPSRVLAHHADRRGDALAVECDGRSWTWAALHERVRVTAGALTGVGAERGDVVGVLLHNDLEFIELMYACAHIGAVFMPLNWRLAGPELNYIVNHARTKLLVTEPELAELVEKAGDLCCDAVIGVAPHGDWLELAKLRDAAERVADPVDVESEDLARLMYTSGTTSRPKGVMISFGNLEAKNIAHIVEFGFTADHRNLVCGPLYHVGGLDMVTTSMLQVGGATYLLRRFEAEKALGAIERFMITHLWMAPVMINSVVDHPSLPERDLSSVLLLSDGGEKMPLPLIQRVLEAFPNAWFADGYGMTETVSGDTFLDKRRTTNKLGSVGRPVCNAEVRVVDEDDRPVPPGTPGEIVMRGPKVCKGYLHDEEATATALRGGWLHTGDVGILDEDGYLFIVDRLKDMIISGGENISSSEVERALYEHPAISEVAVVARPDERWNETPVAYVVARGTPPDSDELTSFCRERLSGYKVPKGFRFVQALPRNPSGKVLKRELRELEQADAGS